jgi:hypothetical protein
MMMVMSSEWQFLQEPHSVTFQRMAFFKISVIELDMKLGNKTLSYTYEHTYICTIFLWTWINTEEWHLLRCYAMWLLLRTDVLEELSISIIRVTRIGEVTLFPSHTAWHPRRRHSS